MSNPLARPIPLEEAAGFFVKLKTAGWADPPDITGMLEGQFSAPMEQALQNITQAITAKFRMVVAYYTFGESMRDLAQHGIGEIFREHAGQELDAAEYYLKRAAVLGGAIHLDSIEPPPASTDPVHIIQTMMRAEQEAIELQRNLHQMLGDQNPMRIEVERIMTEDQHHLDELWQMLPSELHEAGRAEIEAGAGPAIPTGTNQSTARPLMDDQAAPAAGEPAIETKTSADKTAFAALAPLALGIGRKLLTSAIPSLVGSAVKGIGSAIKPELKQPGFAKGLGSAVSGAASGMNPFTGGVSSFGKVATADKPKPSDEELRETGRQRAVTNMAAEAHRERHRRGERIGETVGRAAGALGGAAAGHKFIGGRLGTVAGLASGLAVGGKAGKEVGTEHDIRKNASFSPEALAAIKAKRQGLQKFEKTIFEPKKFALPKVNQGLAKKAAAEFTPDEAKTLQKHRLANHLYVDPMFGVLGAQVGALSGHPLAGLAGGAGIGALLSHGANEQLDNLAQKALAGKLSPEEQRHARQLVDLSAAVPLFGGIGALQGAVIGGTPIAALLGGAAGANLAHKGQRSHRLLLDANERALAKQADSAHIADLIHSSLNAGAKLKPSNYAHIVDATKSVANKMPTSFSMKSLVGGGHPALSGGLGKIAAAMRFKLASMKLGFGPPIDQYLAAEQAGQEAQQQNEADFYRERAQAAQQQMQATQQQISDMQQQLQQLQDAQAQTGASIQAANQEAMSARDDALRQQQISANMRIGYQKLRQQIIDMASQDPEAVGGLPGDVPQGAGQGMVPGQGQTPAEGMQAGQPAATPGATTTPDAVPAEAGGPGAPGASSPGSGADGNVVNDSATAQQKLSSPIGEFAARNMLPIAGGLAGGLVGAREALGSGKKLKERQQALGAAAEAGGGSFGKALELAKAKAELAESNAAIEHPVMTGLVGGLRGAALGAAGGAAVDKFQSLVRQIPAAMRG